MTVIIIAAFLLAVLVAVPCYMASKDNEPPQDKACNPNDDWLEPIYSITDDDAGEMEIPQDIADRLDMEEACEGKTIRTFSCSEIGLIIRFTDGSVFKQIDEFTEYKR